MGSNPRGSLTLILLLDQLPRNAFRDSPFPWATSDPLSLELAEHFVLKEGHDRQHPAYKRIFYYMPFVHSERLPYQELSLAKWADFAWELREGEEKDCHEFAQMGLNYAWKHYEIIEKYNRFPHRNAVLGRETTEEESKYLTESGGKLF